MANMRIKSRSLFFSAFFKNPKELGSITPSSKFLVREFIRSIDLNNAKYIAEYGAGTGVITEQILANSRADAVILSFEINGHFFDYLRSNIKDKRLILIKDDAQNIRKHLKKRNIDKLDCVVCALPFSTLGSQKKEKIFRETKTALKDGGQFIFVRFFPNFETDLNKHFPKNSMKFVMLNLPPSMIYICSK